MSTKSSKDSSPTSENVSELPYKFCGSIGIEWAEEKVESASMLKLIYHGRFLHGSVTLNALNLPQGKTTVMHLVTRENLPEPNSNG
ncbi:Ubiquitin domain-containing protein [Trichostrongylus colubriformis]|uniref:Ubiquitin domain-containing protein n=1 Tax=Trichostrongylus colubriformis TaxID=6319 RepID=A0AAN8INS1_TRICO